MELRWRTMFVGSARSMFATLVVMSTITGCGAAASAQRARVGNVFVGRASYYSDSFEGQSTANGETFDQAQLTAAHLTLPFGTVCRVSRVDDGRAVTVRINDRGPFGNRGRVLDLSRAAAEALGMIREGVIRVRVEILEVPPNPVRLRRHRARRRGTNATSMRASHATADD